MGRVYIVFMCVPAHGCVQAMVIMYLLVGISKVAAGGDFA